MNDEAHRKYCDSQSGVYPALDYEGLLEERWSDGRLKFRGRFEKGMKRVGQHLSFWPNGALQEVSFWEDGWPTGTMLWFREDGSKESEKDFGVFGGKARKWVERCFDVTNHLWSVEIWQDDRIMSEWTEPENREVMDKICFDERIKQFVAELYPNGGDLDVRSLEAAKAQALDEGVNDGGEAP